MRNLTLRAMPVVLSAVFVLTCVGMTRAQDKTVWLICTWDTSSIWHPKTGPEKFERRFYITEPVSMSTETYLKIDSTGDRLEGLCGNYLDKTVVKAATDRGEKLDPGGQLTVIRNIELSGEDIGSKNMYKYGTKDDVIKKRDESVKELKDANRVIYTFNWDVTLKNEATDLENEVKRTGPTLAPAKKN